MKKLVAIVLAGMLTVSLGISAFAAEWAQNSVGKWYQYKDGSYPVNRWEWIDANNDGLAECYHFDEIGYLDTNKTFSDGSVVDGNGAWTVNGVVQYKNVDTLSQKIEGAYSFNGITIPTLLDGFAETASPSLSVRQKMFAEAGVPVENTTVLVTVSAVPLTETRQSFDQLKSRMEAGKESLAESVGNRIEVIEETVDGVYYYVVSGERDGHFSTILYGVSQNAFVEVGVTKKQNRMSARELIDSVIF